MSKKSSKKSSKKANMKGRVAGGKVAGAGMGAGGKAAGAGNAKSECKATKGMKRLEVRELEYTYTDQAEPMRVLRGVSAEFLPGNVYAIRGESGSGKTTLLSLMSALDMVQGGDILYGGKSIREIGLDEFRLKYVNVVFQSYNLIKYMTAIENVEVAIDFGGEKISREESKARALKYLEKVGLDTTASERLVNKLSGGQQQRVAIARALASNVPIIFADEPTGNLDEDTEAMIIKIFKDLAHKEGKIVIIVTHSNVVASQADKTLTLKKGVLA